MSDDHFCHNDNFLSFYDTIILQSLKKGHFSHKFPIIGFMAGPVQFDEGRVGYKAKL